MRKVEPMRWGLVPNWARDPSIGNRMINARSETLAVKNAFKDSFRQKRCLIPADGFFEWQALEGTKRKQPWYFKGRNDDMLAFAGLWSSWQNAEQADRSPLRTCTIITRNADETVAPIHDRMPVIMNSAYWAEWLDPTNDDVGALDELLKHSWDAALESRMVSTLVNRPGNDGSELIETLNPQQGQFWSS